MARTPNKSAKSAPLNLSTAKTADGALKSPLSVYEIVGISTSPYRTTNLAEYQKTLGKMDLYELHSHAYDIGVLPSHSRSIMLDRLERKFIQEHSRISAARQNEIDQKNSDGSKDESAREQTLKILAKGR
jgi:hypothetical protein